MKVKEGYDFSGWATKNDLKCADGRVIRRNAFEVNDGDVVPLVWNHRHDTTSAILGHALLVNKKDGVFTYGYLNNTQAGREAKECLNHGDIVSLSIYANNLVQDRENVIHGAIREVSLVVAGANPGAFVESVVQHGCPIDEDDDEGILFVGEGLNLAHSTDRKKDEDEEDEEDEDEEEKDEEETEDTDDEDEDEDEEKKKMKVKAIAHSADSGSKEKTVQDVIDTMNEEQKQAMYAMIGAAVEGQEGGDEKDLKHSEEDDDMKYNVFDSGNNGGATLTHSDMEQIFKDAKRLGSLRDAVNENIENGVLSHSIDTSGMVGPSPDTASQTYGFRDPDMLFPDYKSLNTPPEWIKRDTGWVSVLMGSIHHTPFSSIKSQFADITEDDARARGYMKGNLKKEEVFTLLKRTTDPQTVYKKQKMDKDDINDITDFDVVAWIKSEMRQLLDEEVARAILVGDGRESIDDDKISADHIRPIWGDDELFTIRANVKSGADDAATAKALIRKAIKARKEYKGSGNLTFFTTEDWLTEMLLLEDGIGHPLYADATALARKLRVNRIVTVPVMENLTNGGEALAGIIVDMKDYRVGHNKGAKVDMFDDFDIDYNQYKYLIETRLSGALTKPFSAIALTVNGTDYAYEETEDYTGSPKAKGYYEKQGTIYRPSNDTSCVEGKTYYEKVEVS